MRAFILSLLALGLAFSAPSSARAVSVAEAVDIGFDVIVLRPAGLVTTCVGGILFVPAAALAAPGGRASVDQAREIFISIPWEATFERPLGDW